MKNYSDYLNHFDNSNYDVYEGYIRGNMFKNLYKPYKKNEPYDIKPMNEQAELLTYIDALCFASNTMERYPWAWISMPWPWDN